MPNYFARVELHDAEWPDDYENLHKELAKIGFTSCLHYTDGGTSKLPTGFYFAKNLEDGTDAISQRVFKAADNTGFSSEITVIKSKGSNSRLNEDCD